MSTLELQVTRNAEVVKPKSPRGSRSAITARQRLRKAMDTIGEHLKAERVQFALLISDQEASIMIEGRVKKGRIGDLANGLLNLSSTLVNETATPAAS